MSDFDTVMNNVESLISEHNQLKAKLGETLREKFSEIFKAFFEKHPVIKTVHWTQYIPGFNDGDECVFSLGELQFSETEFHDVSDPYGEEDEGDVSDMSDVSVDLEKDMRKIETLLNNNEEDILRDMFGVHVWVRAHANGFDTQEYYCGY
jgi:hypothetical protein